MEKRIFICEVLPVIKSGFFVEHSTFHENSKVVAISGSPVKEKRRKILAGHRFIPDLMSLDNAFAGISTTRIGTANSMPTRSEIDKLL